MRFSLNLISLSILSVGAVSTAQANQPRIAKELPTITVEAQGSDHLLLSDHRINQTELQQSAVTLGDALNGKAGIHSDNFGVGSSRPVVRGQSGQRLKVTASGSDLFDASQVSPDHAMSVDPILAKQINIYHGPSTLQYGGGLSSGVIDVVDQRIPTAMPDRPIEGQATLRYGTAADEKLAAVGATVGLGSNIALRVEGISNHSNDYKVRGYEHEGVPEDRVSGTASRGDNFSFGGSWIGERGYAGIAYSERNSNYGLPGHSHEYESCHPHGTHLHCGTHDEHAHDDEEHDDHDDDHSVHDDHDDHDHEAHSHDVPVVDLHSRRFDFRAEYNQPFSGIEKVKAQASYTDYEHDELEHGEVSTTFKNEGYDGRISFEHAPILGWQGVFGAQYAENEFSTEGTEAFIPKNTTKRTGIFLVEKYRWNDVLFEAGARHDWQKIDVDGSNQSSDLNATSVSASANWQFHPSYYIATGLSHNQRLPIAQELYSNGTHLATNTWELGNENLDKETSNNVELSLGKNTGKLNFEVTAFYNDFEDYIHAKTLDRFENYRLIQYQQDDAEFYGAEFEMNYAFSPAYSIDWSADYVEGKLDDGEHLERIPAARTAVQFNANFDDGWSGYVGYVHNFEQNNIAFYESPSSDFGLVNAGVSYTGNLSDREYRVFLDGANLLDKQYYNHASYLSTIPQVGRNFNLGISVDF